MPNTVLVDGSNIAHANDQGAKLTVGTMQTQAIYGTLRSARAMLNDYRGWGLVFLWDGRAQWRYDLFPEYKANRAAKTPEEEAEKAAYQRQVPVIRKMLQLLGVRQIMATTQEADDLAGFFTRHITDAGSRVINVSGDTDWLQLVGPLAQWFDPIKDRRVTHVNFFEKTGYFDQHAFIEGKALIGDSSDNIDGIPRIGKKTAPEVLAQFRSVGEFFRQVDSGEFIPKYVVHKNLASVEGRALFERNMRLMDLRAAVCPPANEFANLAPTFNPDHFRVLCEKLNFRSVLRDFDTFIFPFREANNAAE